MKRLSPKTDPEKQKQAELRQRLTVIKDKEAKGGKLTLEDLDEKLDVLIELIRK